MCPAGSAPCCSLRSGTFRQVPNPAPEPHRTEPTLWVRTVKFWWFRGSPPFQRRRRYLSGRTDEPQQSLTKEPGRQNRNRGLMDPLYSGQKFSPTRVSPTPVTFHDVTASSEMEAAASCRVRTEPGQCLGSNRTHHGSDSRLKTQ